MADITNETTSDLVLRESSVGKTLDPKLVGMLKLLIKPENANKEVFRLWAPDKAQDIARIAESDSVIDTFTTAASMTDVYDSDSIATFQQALRNERAANDKMVTAMMLPTVTKLRAAIMAYNKAIFEPLELEIKVSNVNKRTIVGKGQADLVERGFAFSIAKKMSMKNEALSLIQRAGHLKPELAKLINKPVQAGEQHTTDTANKKRL
jgi:hypothetical protein